jgi:hypothetical protein
VEHSLSFSAICILKYKAGAAACLSFPNGKTFARLCHCTKVLQQWRGNEKQRIALLLLLFAAHLVSPAARWFVAAAASARTKELQDDDDDSILLSLVLLQLFCCCQLKCHFARASQMRKQERKVRDKGNAPELLLRCVLFSCAVRCSYLYSFVASFCHNTRRAQLSAEKETFCVKSVVS